MKSKIDYFEELFLDESLLLHLQLFAAEDEGRTEPPSERRRREEREKGNVPKSNEVSSVLVLIGAVIVLYLVGDSFLRDTGAFIRKYLSKGVEQEHFGNEEFRVLLGGVVRDFFSLLWPVFGITMVFAIAGNIVQTGFIFAPKALAFRFDRISPNFKKILPNKQTMFNLIKSLAKVIVIGFISYLLIRGDFLKILLTGSMSIKQAVSLVGYSGFKIMMSVGIFLLAIAFADFLFQKSEFEDSLKQSPSEAKREMKEDGGDPGVKSRRMQIARDMMQRNMLKSVPNADVVITNPTHFSVALQYNYGVDTAPRVIAKGEDAMALAIRRIAKENDIPIVENPPLARVLYSQVEIDQEIPNEFFKAVSTILISLEKFKRKIAR